MMRGWQYRHMPKPRRKDNSGRQYEHDSWNIRNVMKTNTLESFLIKLVRQAREKWINDPFQCDDNFELLVDDSGNPIYDETIWDMLALEDSKFSKQHGDGWRIRVPKLVHSNREWDNFYRTFPYIAKGVMLGTERFNNGAKLKFTPMMEKILEKEWPKEENHKLNKGQYNHGLEMLKVHKIEHEDYLRRQAEDDARWEAWLKEQAGSPTEEEKNISNNLNEQPI